MGGDTSPPFSILFFLAPPSSRPREERGTTLHFSPSLLCFCHLLTRGGGAPSFSPPSVWKGRRERAISRIRGSGGEEGRERPSIPPSSAAPCDACPRQRIERERERGRERSEEWSPSSSSAFLPATEDGGKGPTFTCGEADRS